MVQCIKVPKSSAEEAKKYLIANGYLDADYVIGNTTRSLIFPLSDEADIEDIINHFPKATLETRNLTKKDKSGGSFKELLKGVIPDAAIDQVKRSYDVVGDIAVVEIPSELESVEKSIAWTLKRTKANIAVVVKKFGRTQGPHIIRVLKPLIGTRTETIHKENGIRIKVDLNKAYFSSRLSTERSKIADLVKERERILVMFSGVAPYPLVILKKQPKVKEIHAVDFNPDAVFYAKENLQLNKNIVKKLATKKKPASELIKEKIILHQGDVDNIVPSLGKFDRIIMVLPFDEEQHFRTAFNAAKQGGIVHYYRFVPKDDIDFYKDKIIKAAKTYGKKVKVVDAIKAGQHSPGVYRMRFDIKVE